MFVSLWFPAALKVSQQKHEALVRVLADLFVLDLVSCLYRRTSASARTVLRDDNETRDSLSGTRRAQGSATISISYGTGQPGGDVQLLVLVLLLVVVFVLVVVVVASLGILTEIVDKDDSFRKSELSLVTLL